MSINYRYTFYGLIFQLPFPCPILPVAPLGAPPDVSVIFGLVPKILENALASDDSWKSGFCWQASPGCYLLRGGLRSGCFLVEDGKHVTVERNPSAEDDRIFRTLEVPPASKTSQAQQA